MLNPCSIPVTKLEKPAPPPSTFLNDYPLSVWSQMNPTARQLLSQRIAELIRRIRFPLVEKEVCDDETV
jgi:hypothetical protein